MMFGTNLHRGECFDNELDELLCAKADVGESTLELDLLGLTPGLPYFLRVDAFSATATPNWGDFILCVDSLQQVNTIDEGGSTSCSGELFDTGGPDDDYSSNENNVFEICPPAPSNECITFNLEYYNFEDNGDIMNIYSGTNGTGGTLLASVGGGFEQNNIGGVCLSVQGTGCITVEFISDSSVEFEGFAANWECSTMPCDDTDLISINDNITEQDIIDAVSSPQTVVSNIIINCPQGAYGTFQAGDNSDLGLERGIILTSGSATQVGNIATDNASIGNSAPGDSDLDYFSTSGTLSNDACVIEMDVFAATDELTFEYVFGSEEYPEFVNSNFNDIFAFLISGPGIAGDPNINNQLNIATLPDGNNTLVTINSVNFESNWQYYRDNQAGESIVYDGLTSDYFGEKKSLTASATVDPCNTYHLKLAIADRTDFILDSGVFVSDIKGGTPQLSVNFSSGIDYLIEGCSGTDDELLVSLNNPQDEISKYGVSISGTATNGVDYILNMPDTVILEPGETLLNFPLIPLVDNLMEGTETIIISLSNNFGCGTINFAEITIELEDEPQVEINLGQDTAFVCANNGITLEVSGATTYFWTPVSIIDPPTSASPFVTPTANTWVNVVGQVGPCTDTDSIYLNIIDPEISIMPLLGTNICEGDVISLQAINNVNDQGLVWDPGTNLPDPNATIISDMPPVTTTYTATVELEGCQESASITVNVDEFDFPDFTALDTTLCQSFTFDLASPIPGTTTTYQWLPNENMNDNTLPNPTVAATAGTVVYTVTATSENAYCSQTGSVTVTGIPASAPISNPDTIEICLGEMVDLAANTSTAGAGFQWQSNPFDATLNPVTDTMVTVTPEISTTYYTELMVGACTVYDSVFVRVDSLPDLSLEQVPFKDIYCANDIVSLVSPTYEPSFYPDIMHQWSPASSIVSDLENLNLVIVADQTTSYTRVTTNRACSETQSLTLEVVTAELQLSWTDTTICAGEEVEIMELFGEGNFSWDPMDGIATDGNSNTETLNPTTTTTYSVTATVSDCPATATAVVNVGQSPEVIIEVDSTMVYPIGTKVTFFAMVSNPSPGDIYSWTYNGQPIGTPGPIGVGDTIEITILEANSNNSNLQNLVEVTVVNSSNCQGKDNVNILGEVSEFFIPNAFTPNGDGINDFLNVSFDGQSPDNLGPFEVVRFSVWNRWGNLVYNNENPTQGWDGTIDGKPAPAEVYVFFVQIRLLNGEIVDVFAPTSDEKNDGRDVTLIR